jgi:hypothetical protein
MIIAIGSILIKAGPLTSIINRKALLLFRPSTPFVSPIQWTMSNKKARVAAQESRARGNRAFFEFVPYRGQRRKRRRSAAKPTQQRRGAADRGEYRQAAGISWPGAPNEY